MIAFWNLPFVLDETLRFIISTPDQLSVGVLSTNLQTTVRGIAADERKLLEVAQTVLTLGVEETTRLHTKEHPCTKIEQGKDTLPK